LPKSLFHPRVASGPAPAIILYLPPGPLLPTAFPTVDAGAALSSVTSATVVQINYRCSQEHRYPTPIHDVLTGYDWVLEHLVPSRSFYRPGRSANHSIKLAVCGELVGGSLAAMLALTECRLQGPYVAAAAINEPVIDWVFPEDEEVEHETSVDRLASYVQGLQIGQKSKAKSRLRQTSFSTFGDNTVLNASTLLKARRDLFRRPEDYFDTFASPILNFRTSGVSVPPPPQLKSAVDEFAELALFERDEFHRQQIKMSALSNRPQSPDQQEESTAEATKKPRKSYRRWPNAGSGLRIPQMHISSAVTSPLSDQVEEFSRLMQKSIVSQELKTVEAEGDDMAKEAAYMLAERQIQHRQPDNLRLWSLGIIGIIIIVILAIVIPVAVVLSNKNKSSATGAASATSTSSSSPANKNLDGMSESDIPKEAQGTILDPFTWYDTTDFNVTYTAATVGGLSIMGLNETWDDSTKANDNVPALNETWEYGKMPIRGVNIGGWFSIEPVITPSLFSDFKTSDGVIDEWTLCSKLRASRAQTTLEQHYASFVSEADFAGIQAAGFDHVRIPFSYWAVTTYDGDPYVPKVSWRYLLRAIEWARKYGLRINLDLHGAPGSQNGWNHSGHQGAINWLNGTDGTINGQRTLDIHSQLSTFFAQPRYKNIIAIYGLVNEPKMTYLDVDTVLTWTKTAIQKIRSNNMTAIITFGDGFRGLDNWQGELQDFDNLLLDVHQYVIFNNQQIALDHAAKVDFACGGWTNQTLRSSNKATGFGPTLCGEWSQADTDCATYLNNVGVGSRWEGTLNMVSTPGGSLDGSVLNPTCPTANSPRCSCTNANASPSSYSAAYKQWLLNFAEAQMYSFEQGWGWFYWTWKTESATQWSYKDGLAAGILPEKTWERTFKCGSIPDYAGMGLPENY
ncbi:glycoside hydrolase, partial [Aureobasidium melanogenum]